MSFPDGYLWEYPGFPSITVSYLKTNDFFFSGHVGLPIIGALEFYGEEKMPLACFCMFTCLLEFFTMIITRGHYLIDLICGVIIAHYVYMLVDRYIYLVDGFTCLSMRDSEEARVAFEKL
jgi:hypothetical protein